MINSMSSEQYGNQICIFPNFRYCNKVRMAGAMSMADKLPKIKDEEREGRVNQFIMLAIL